MPPSSVVTVPARPEYVRVLCVAAEALGATAGLSADSIDDLELAVEEASAALLTVAAAEEIRLEVSPTGSGIECRMSVTGPAPGRELQIDRLRRRVLEAVGSAVEVDPARAHISLRVESEPSD